ncbi:MAG: DUF3149 domain-containing protein [Betaproteobacteria bacterium]|nr:DUF3149 domain-containing protein [Betaproteobacteria bacterium]
MSPLTQLLFGSDIGLLSLATIGVVIAMGGFFIAMFVRKSREENDS